MHKRKFKKWINKTLGEKIKKIRLAKGLKETDITNKIDLTLKKYIKIEKGYYKLTFLELLDIRKILDVKIVEIIKVLDKKQKKIK